jgi:hypothetical protein
MKVSLFEIHQLHYQNIPLKIKDDRIPEEYLGKKITNFSTVHPLMVGGYLLKVEGVDDAIRLSGVGNTDYPFEKLKDLEVELCL